MIVFFVDHLTRGEISWASFYVIIVFLSHWEQTEEFTVTVATFCSLLTILGAFFSASAGPPELAVSNRFIALFLIWLTTVLVVQRKKLTNQRDFMLKEKEEALARIKVLSGLLPICSSCKKIRNDEGYWTHVESYLAEHSEAKFTHGICEPCREKLYPQIHLNIALDGK